MDVNLRLSLSITVKIPTQLKGSWCGQNPLFEPTTNLGNSSNTDPEDVLPEVQPVRRRSSEKGPVRTLVKPSFSFDDGRCGFHPLLTDWGHLYRQ